jgi:probable selenium-dependent hydroxylase accessory protein YqeC
MELPDLIDVLAARAGIVCVVGAGGKKSTLYRLAMTHPGPVGLTSTVHTPPFPRNLGGQQIVLDGELLLSAVCDAAAGGRLVAYASPSKKQHRMAGVTSDLLARIHIAAGFAVTLVKADGARGRWIKAPDLAEPQIPETAATVIPVVSVRALGEALSARIAHRPERIATLTGARLGEPITTEHVARLLADERGVLKAAGTAQVVPLINMVENPRQEALARETASRALELSARFERVVLAAMTRSKPVVGVVGRLPSQRLPGP